MESLSLVFKEGHLGYSKNPHFTGEKLQAQRDQLELVSVNYCSHLGRKQEKQDSSSFVY